MKGEWKRTRKGKELKDWKERKGRKGRGTKEQGHEAYATPKHICYVVASTFARLSNDKTGSSHILERVTQLRGWWLRPQTHHQAPRESIHQVVQMKTSEAAAGEPDDRCIWQMVPSALASGQQQTSPSSSPLAAFIVRTALRFLSSFCHAATPKGGCSKAPVSPSRPLWLEYQVHWLCQKWFMRWYHER